MRALTIFLLYDILKAQIALHLGRIYKSTRDFYELQSREVRSENTGEREFARGMIFCCQLISKVHYSVRHLYGMY